MAEQKYRVIKRLAAGGMAEVFLGESSSVQGFVKQVAIKRVLPHLGQNPKFIQMFLDEARLSAKLNHANIVTVFDVGSTENTFFLVMEFVDGTNLKELMENARKRHRQFEPKQALFVGIEACRGLSYAHELTDETGKLLNIVHRDISPPNIMITKRGEIKVADFGLAKAGMNVEKTEPGVVKGKFGYLAPEVALGEEADARSDVFSLGVVLWEMLAGRRLFLGETDFHTVKLVRAANIPRLVPLNRFVDEGFEEMLLRALTREPAHRYQTAREFGDAMAGYLFEKGLKVTAFDIANLVTTLTSQKKQVKEGDQSIMDRLIEEELGRFTSLDEEPVSGPAATGTAAHPGAAFGGDDLENPADWFHSDSLLPGPPDTAGLGQQVAARVQIKSRAGDQARTAPAAANATEQPLPPPPLPPPPPVPSERRPAPGKQATAPAGAGSDASPAEKAPTASRQVFAAPAQPASSGSGGLKYVVLAIAVAAAGAAAWFGNLIPH